MKITKFYSSYEDNDVTIFKTDMYKLIAIKSTENQIINISSDVDDKTYNYLVSKYYNYDISFYTPSQMAKYETRLIRY